jgi:FOG: FHA domain
MAKYKIKTKDRTLIVRVKLSFSEKLNERELDSFARKYIRGLLKVKIIKNGCIEYTGPIGISLDEKMKKPISKHDFFFIIEQIVDITQKLNINNMDINNIKFDIKNVYINEITKEMQFIYLPLEQIKSGANIIEFIENIIYSVIPMQEQDKDYVSKFTYFLRSLSGYNANAIEKYIFKEDKSIVNTIKKRSVGQSGFMTDKPKDYYEHYGRTGDETTGILSNRSMEHITPILSRDETTGILLDEDEETGRLDEDEKTGRLNEEETGRLIEDEVTILKENVHYATLYRILTNETIEINKPVFRIGKEHSYSDYFVSNNDKVSRGHADIIVRNGKYFVKDLNSRNRTFINGQAIPVQQETEIFEGNSLRLANEEFIFHV